MIVYRFRHLDNFEHVKDQRWFDDADEAIDALIEIYRERGEAMVQFISKVPGGFAWRVGIDTVHLDPYQLPIDDPMLMVMLLNGEDPD